MPPPLEEMSDDESTGGSIPFEDNNHNNHNNDNEQEKPPGQPGNDENEEDEEDEEDDDEEGVYVVEQVVGHEFAKNVCAILSSLDTIAKGNALTMRQGALLLQVKWKGYDDPADQTLEPEENLMEGAKDVVEEYYRIQGGRPGKSAAGPKKRKSTQPKQTPEKTEAKKPRKSRGVDEDADANSDLKDMPDWVPRTKSWEDHVEGVETISSEPGTNILVAMLMWKNGKKSKVSLETCYNRCPKKMLKFYEEHL